MIDAYMWWGFDQIKNIPDEDASSTYPGHEPTIWANVAKYLYFADYMVWCWAWAINCSDDENRGRVIVVGWEDTCFVADSFSELVTRYTADPKGFAMGA